MKAEEQIAYIWKKLDEPVMNQFLDFTALPVMHCILKFWFLTPLRR